MGAGAGAHDGRDEIRSVSARGLASRSGRSCVSPCVAGFLAHVRRGGLGWVGVALRETIDDVTLGSVDVVDDDTYLRLHLQPSPTHPRL